MGIDKETEINYMSISLDGSSKYLNELRKQAEEDGANDEISKGKPKKLNLTCDKHSMTVEEYYFDDGEITFSAEMVSAEGESYVHFTLPISDIVLIDILQYSMKKLSKLKTAMETLK